MVGYKTLILLIVTSILVPVVIGLPFSLPNFGDTTAEGITDNLPDQPKSRIITDARKNAEKSVGNLDE